MQFLARFKMQDGIHLLCWREGKQENKNKCRNAEQTQFKLVLIKCVLK